MRLHPMRRTALATAAMLTLTLAACGGGDEDVAEALDADDEGGAEIVDAADDDAEQRAQMLAVTTGSTGNRTCRNQLLGAIVVDNLTVPDGAACRLSGTHVIGSIKAGTGSQLDARNVVVNGNVAAEGATAVAVSGASRIGGSVQIKQGGSASVLGARITGDLQFDAMSRALVASGNRIGGNLQAVANRGGTTLIDNRIDGNLQCKENSPAPRVRNNTAASIEDQCAVSTTTPPIGGGVVPAPAGLSGNVTCRNLAIGAVSLDTVIVPANASCTLSGTQLIGSILVGENARVEVRGVRANGNLQAEGAASVVLTGSASSFGGSVQIKQGGGASVAGARIGVDLQVDAMRAPVSAAGNVVGGNVQVMSNRGGVALTRNRIDGNLQCKGNQPTPVGSGNTAASKEDQCRNL